MYAHYIRIAMDRYRSTRIVLKSCLLWRNLYLQRPRNVDKQRTRAEMGELLPRCLYTRANAHANAKKFSSLHV